MGSTITTLTKIWMSSFDNTTSTSIGKKTKKKTMKKHEFVHMKHYVFSNENKSVSNNIMGCNMFLTRRTMKK
jgi:hypothetical protein